VKLLILFLIVCFLGCTLNLGTIGYTTSPPQKAPTEAQRRKRAIELRQRLVKGDPNSASFWRDVKELEALGPADIKIAVVRHPSGVFVHAYKNIHGFAVADHDLILGPFEMVRAQQEALRGDSRSSVGFAAIHRNRETWWPEGRVPFEIAGDLERRARNAIKDAIADYERLTPVRFHERTVERSYVKFVKQWHVGLASMTDSSGANGGKVEIKLETQNKNDTLKDRNIIAATARHEIGHALGLFHEHGRSDRDDFVEFDSDCSSYDRFYEFFGQYEIERESKRIGLYDFLSIMHYASAPGEKGPPWDRKPCFNMVKRASLRAAGDTTGELFTNEFLSAGDVNALHHMYGRNGHTTTTGDDYGWNILVHNFDPPGANDPFPDLAVAAPGFNEGRGVVFLYKGTASGLVLWKVLMAAPPQPGQRFGESMAAGDFDRDGLQELAVGAPRTTVNGKASAGKVYLFRIRGDREKEQIETITKPSQSGSIEVMDRFGQSLAAGVFFDKPEEVTPLRTHLAIGAPGARDGSSGRVGRVWVMNKDSEPTFRAVRIGADALKKFGQFGFSFAVLLGRSPTLRPQDLLVVSAPGMTFGPCGRPAVFTLRENAGTLETGAAMRRPNEAPERSTCPEDPNWSDATDANLITWDAGWGGRMTSGDLNGDGQSDLVFAYNTSIYVYLRDGKQLVFQGTVSNSTFGEQSPESSFGNALATGDLNGDGRDELIVGAPLTDEGNLSNVGRVYVFRLCEAAPNTARHILCEAGLSTWFRAHQTDFPTDRVPDTNALIIGDFNAPDILRVPPFTTNIAGDQFGRAVAIMKSAPGAPVSLFIAGPYKSIGTRSHGGAVFIFQKSLTSDSPPFRNEGYLTEDFTTRISRN
jgi:hypothetical protein